MYIRKIAAAAGFACGAALAFAPLASADPSSFAVGTLDSEIASQNSIFEAYAALSGDSADITKGGTGVYDTFTTAALQAKDAPYLPPNVSPFGDVTTLEHYIYGTNPILAGISGDTGPYNVYNGALTEFYDAYNVAAFAAQNNGALDTNPDDYLGSAHSIATGLGYDAATNTYNGTVSSAEQYFYNFGVGDLNGFNALFTPASTGVGDILPYQADEIGDLNVLFEQDGQLANVYGDIIPHTATGTNVGFDTIPSADLNTTFNDLVFGAAGPSSDPGSYDVYNGAFTEFFNAQNVGLYALLNSGQLLPQDLVFGTHDFTGSVATVFGDYLNLGFQDLLGYFIPASAAAAF